MSASDREFRSVLVPAGNKLQQKPLSKPVKKTASKSKDLTFTASPAKKSSSPLSPSILRRNGVSMNASYSSEASSSCESSPLSMASTSSGKRGLRRTGSNSSSTLRRNMTEETGDCFSDGRRRCAWITPKSDLCYIAFHDEEWGVPVHDDKKLFELLSLSGALAELSWKDILSKRQSFREVFMDFDPIAISELTNKKITSPDSLLSEQKLRSILENANQVRKIIVEFGSFGKYIWNFVNQKPTQSQFRYSRQVPVKTSKAELISKDLVRRGFRSVSPTVIYSFMQTAGLTNDHLTSCFRHQECISKDETS
ncbi:PREDICTED: DNA-3-methyladenine glycosylase 1-like isoform X2 [Brassica oleracea var. oleracea]|nr:PREDICTED: DNA-3-methyladenine glycosylase 1-like isoform X2 [Brassica oleracea var. oleracea]